jgi:peptide/nickel transport system substrate-binding protein
MRSTLCSTILAMLGLTVVACTPLSPAPATTAKPTAVLATMVPVPPRSGGILRIGQAAGDIGTADPHYASSTSDRALVDMVFNGLIRYTPGDVTAFEPDLATSLPQVSTTADGQQVWTFSLRQGVLCHPSEGVPPYTLTSEDVVYSLQQAANTASSAYAGDYAGMTFASTDAYTVTVTLTKPLSTALFYPRVANYSGGYILCKRAAERLGPDGLKTHPVGTGPFMFESYTPKE